VREAERRGTRVTRAQLSRRFEEIKGKRGAGLAPTQSTSVDDVLGDVFNTTEGHPEFGEYIGNVFDDF
jgi:hypothetical protein